MSFMNSLKCSKCGLTNFPDVFDCRRCGHSLLAFEPQKKRVARTPRWLSVWSLLMIAIVVGIVYYFYHGVQTSMLEIEEENVKRQALQPRPQPAGLSRTEAERQRTGSYGNLVSNSQGLAAHHQHIDDTKKVINQVSNSQPAR